MSFHVSTSGSGADEIIYLEDSSNGTKAEIYAFGALLNSFSISVNGEKRNVMYGFQNTSDAKENIIPLFQSAKLSPFVCRMKEGRYTFANEKHKIEKYYHNREALHGLLFDELFSIKSIGENSDSAFVTLSFDYNKTDPGYPFFYRIDITYRLEAKNRLTITTHVLNLNNVQLPIADGWHPYFGFDKQVDTLLLTMNTASMVEFDSKLLPTGHMLPYSEFVESKPIGNTRFDNCFVLNELNGGPACQLEDPQSGISVSIYPAKNYPFLQVFIPDNRHCIAIENLSSLPDSFNNAIGLTILEPAETRDFVTTLQIQQR